MEDNLCEYCSEPSTTTRKIYEPDTASCVEVNVCFSCGIAIDDNLLKPDPFDPY